MTQFLDGPIGCLPVGNCLRREREGNGKNVTQPGDGGYAVDVWVPGQEGWAGSGRQKTPRRPAGLPLIFMVFADVLSGDTISANAQGTRILTCMGIRPPPSGTSAFSLQFQTLRTCRYNSFAVPTPTKFPR